jgi:UDP-N-acetylmuramate dehydrogenase
VKTIENFLKEKGISYKKNQPLAAYTTLGIGGKADFIIFPDEENLLDVMEVIKNEAVPFYVIGGGSNLLISDKGFKGVIINTKKMDNIKLDGFTLTAGAGARLGRVLAFLLKRNLSGMEGLAGIPGSVGGAVYGNAGSFGYEIKDCLDEVEVVNQNMQIIIFKKSELALHYRNSGLPENSIIKNVKFILKEAKKDIFSTMKEFLHKKRATQPLKDRSAGCVFKNPDGYSAGFLIDKSGLKGIRVGDIVVSSVHANYFINVGKGRAEDFLKLMDIVKEKVFKSFSIELEPEIKFLEV